MAPSTWQEYKRDTRYLLKWLVDRSNAILKRLKTMGEDVPRLNTTGEIRISDIVSTARFISENQKETPSVVFRLFEYVINARRTYYNMFQTLLADKADPKLKRSNESHKYVIDAFSQAFEMLGGHAWQKNLKQGGDSHEAVDLDEIFTNKFMALNIADAEVDEGGESDEGSETEVMKDAGRRPQKKKPKKGARGKKSKKKQKNSSAVPDDIPLESYRIIEADDLEITADYLIGAYALVKEWSDLRDHIQHQWRDVAYNKANSVIAAALTTMAIAMVKRTAALIDIDFPGQYDTYKTIKDAVTRGDPKSAQLSSVLSIYMQGDESPEGGPSGQDADVKEQLLIYTYEDLLAFIHDFRKLRSGKPTKAMLKDLKKWDSNADLRRLNKDERLQWRRRFTINWLYDLLSVFTYLPIMENKTKGKNHDLSKIDWSIRGPYWNGRTMWGLKDFASNVARLAYQEENAEDSKIILPHLVFELSCIVDSLTVSRGWSLSRIGAHVLEVAAVDFSATRDIDAFLDRDRKKSQCRGYLSSMHVLEQRLCEDVPGTARDRRAREISILGHDLGRTLGVVGRFIEHATGPDWSRFSTGEGCHSGLWEYSPFLCGAGLMEALDLAFRFGMKVWDIVIEMNLSMHLYNMLRNEDYILIPAGVAEDGLLFGALQDLFADVWFVDGEAPSSDYDKAWEARAAATKARLANPVRRSQARHNAQISLDNHDDYDLHARAFFYAKSQLILYEEADWNPERIREADIHLPSALGYLRIGNTKVLEDPVTGNRSLMGTELVEQARGLGYSEPSLIAITSPVKAFRADGNEQTEGDMANTARHMVPGISEDSEANEFLMRLKKRTGGGKYGLEGTDLLRLVRNDIEEDVVGVRPLSGINYMWVALHVMWMWNRIEDSLSAAEHPYYLQVYKGTYPRVDNDMKRLILTRMALQSQDKELLNIMMEAFEEFNKEFITTFFWGE